MKRDFIKELNACVLACVAGCGKTSFAVTVNGNELRCKPNIEGGVNVYVKGQRKPTKALTRDELVEWASECEQVK